MIHYAEQNNLITDEQYGGRQNRMAQSVVLNKICYYNLSHQTLTRCAFMDDDARACYDRIITSLSSVECRRWGMSYKVASFTNNFIESQQYHIRSAYGISHNYYKFNPSSPTQGSGQGLSWAGPRWTNTGSNISDVMAKSNTGMTFSDPTGTISVNKRGDFFVDDTATGVSENNIHDGKTVLQHLEKDEQKHALLLFATGHMLALYKCLFYYSVFKLSGTKFVHSTISDEPGEIHIRPKHNGFLEKIRRLEPNEAHKTLGCHVAIDMNQEKQIEILSGLIKRWVTKIQSSPLSKIDKLHAYKAYLEKMLLYVLPTCSMTYQQCLRLDKLLGTILCHAHGFQRNSNRSIIYNGKEMGGLNIFSIYHLQGIAKIQFLFKHYRAMDTTGKLLITSIRYTQLELGTSKPFFTDDFYKYTNIITPTWITNLWQYIGECHAQIHEFDPWIYTPPRDHDFFLMDEIYRSNIPDTHKEIFNRVRINLRLLTVSDIVIVDSPSKIIPSLYEGTTTRFSTYNWPTQQELPEKWQQIFNEVLDIVIKPKLMNTSLGKWRSRGHQLCVYGINEENGEKLPVTTVDEANSVTEIDWDFMRNRILGYRRIDPILLEDKTQMDMVKSIKKYPKWMQSLWRHNNWTQSEFDAIIERYDKNKLCACGDGIVRDQWGSIAWSFANTDDYKEIVTKVTPVDGNPNTMKKLRSEATSVLTILITLSHIEKYATSSEKTCTIYVNCKGLINKITNPYLHSPSLVISDHIDIIWQIREVLTNLSTTILFQHTQPPKIADMDKATPSEKLFSRMHKLSKEYFKGSTFKLPNNYPPLFPGQKICITYKSKIIEANLERFLQASERKLITEEYFFKSMNIPPQALQHIDQFALNRVLSRNKSHHAIYSKIINKQLNTMTVNKLWNLGTETCPLCCQEKEDWAHVLQCPAPAPKIHRDLWLARFEEKLIFHNTYPPLADMLYDFFKKGTLDSPDEPIIVNPNFLLSFHTAYQHQTAIGWRNMARGLIAKTWKSIQFDYYRQQQCKDIFAVDKWARMIIYEILEYNRTMWGNRCNIVAEEKTATFETRQRVDIHRLYLYLKQNPNELPTQAHHYLEEHESFFERAPLDNILMWKRGVEVSITSKTTHRETNIKRYFKKQKIIKQISTPKTKKQNKHRTATKRKRKTKKIKTQSSLSRHFTITSPNTNFQQDINNSDNDNSQSPEQVKKRRLTPVGNKITRYQQNLQTFYEKHNIVPVPSGFKRHIEVSPTNEDANTTNNSNKRRKRYDHRNDPSFLPLVIAN